jgi:hypothetical protein
MERVTYNKCTQTQKMLQVLCLQMVIISMRFAEKNLPSRHFEEIAEERISHKHNECNLDITRRFAHKVCSDHDHHHLHQEFSSSKKLP